MASTATDKFGLQISKSHGPTRGGVGGLSSLGLLKGPFFATLPNSLWVSKFLYKKCHDIYLLGSRILFQAQNQNCEIFLDMVQQRQWT